MARPDLLVHWTGRDISTSLGTLTDPERRQYVERLLDILNKGFWMTRPQESLTGNNVRAPAGQISFNYEVDMTCFTEVRLSASETHARAYGLMGVAVDRKYVLERWGSPVHYVRNSRDEWIVGSFVDAMAWINKQPAGLERDSAKASIQYLGTFVKPMSKQNADDFFYIDEHEWRVVQTNEQITKGAIVATGIARPAFRLVLRSSDVRLVVFPDESTRSMAGADSRFSGLLFGGGRNVPMLTIGECSQF